MSIKKIFDNLEELIGTVLFIILFLILIAQIVSRQIFDAPIIWSEELSTLLFVYIGMLGVSIGIKTKQHVYIDFIYNKFTGIGLKLANTFIQIIVFASILSMILIGYRLFLRKLIFQLIALQISAGWLYASLPLISTLMLFRYFQVLKSEYDSGALIISKEKGVN